MQSSEETRNEKRRVSVKPYANHREKRNEIPANFYGNSVMDNPGKTHIQVESQDAMSGVYNVGRCKTKGLVSLQCFKCVPESDFHTFNDEIRLLVQGIQ